MPGARSNARALACATCSLLFTILASCSSPPGPLFDPKDAGAYRWPPAPDAARVAYLGQLRSDADLKPGKGGLKGLGEALFGKEEPKPMLRPMAVCTDGMRLFVADSDARLIHVFDLTTRKYQQWQPPKKERPFLQPVALAWDPAGRLLVADSQDGCIVVLDSGGRYLGRYGDNWLHRPCGVAVDPDRRRLLVIDSAAHQIVVLGLDGQHLERIGGRGNEPGQFNFPTNIALDSQGRIYVSDSLNFRVQVFSPDLKPVRTLGRKGDLPGYFAQPKGLVLDTHDRLYVVDANFEAVQVFDKDGELLMSFGREGHGPGEFWLPAGIAREHSRIWIADSFNKRVQAFEVLEDGGADAK